MKKIAVQFTVEELQALLTLADNQLFRMKFIDPKIPGYRNRPDELRAAQSAVQTLQESLNKEKGRVPKTQGGAALQLVPKG
ncbi:MAG: hypothetical protein JNN08_15605 [Bryobacterales bacterium]|jgi:hypothetical protein|nr:hypothetical protein [Bryobacterales bacterium]